MADMAVLAALDLVEIVLVLLHKEVRLKRKVQGDIEDVRGWLGTIQACLKETEGKEGGPVQKDREKNLRDVAYDIEDVLDEFLLQVLPQISSNIVSEMARETAHIFTDGIALHQLSSSIKDIKRKKENHLGSDLHLPPQEGSSSNSMVEDQATYLIPAEDEVVGFKEQKEELKQQLLREEAGRKIISVVGPPGSGKSILVRSVYKEKSVLRRYDCHAWLSLSRSFNIDEKVLRRLLEQFCEGLEEHLCSPSLTVGEKLRVHLQQRRYLLVLDDLWSKEHWDRIVSSLPLGVRGSSIVVTTSNSDVVSFYAPSEHHILQLKPLSWPDNWLLFCKKAFPGDEQCPAELKEYSQIILTKCEGLPFAIVAVGSLLSNRSRTPHEFRIFLDSLGSEIAPDSNLSRIEKILLPSYMDLSGRSNLKSCFLYFSIFPEDYSIRRGRLIRLWIAEGFIKAKRGKTLEMVADEYLNELIARNLVHVSSWDSTGRVTTCRVLNLVREFLIEKSHDENFVKILAEQGTGSSEKVRRLSIQNGLPQKKDLVLSKVRALFLFQRYDSLNSKIKELLRQFKLLKVLDLEGSPLESFPKKIFQLSLLRYLSLRETNIKKVPKSIKKLMLLETLNLKQTYVTKLPKEILSLEYLRHLLVCPYKVKNYVTFESVKGVEFPAGIRKLRELQKLSLLSANSEAIEQLGDLLHLTKLGLIDLKEEDGRKLCASIMKMEKYLLTLDVRSTGPEEFLDLDHMANDRPFSLERLYLKGRLKKLPGWISSSSLGSLVRIHLKWSKLNTDNNPLRALGALPNLLELQMVDSYMGESLEFVANSFEKLKILHLEHFARLNLVVVQANAMPKLEKLTLCKCNKLEILPLGISWLIHLEELCLYDMNERFLERLNEDREGSQIDQIKIIHSFTRGSNQLFSFQNLS